jgi:hypothetical protein
MMSQGYSFSKSSNRHGNFAVWRCPVYAVGFDQCPISCRHEMCKRQINKFSNEPVVKSGKDISFGEIIKNETEAF